MVIIYIYFACNIKIKKYVNAVIDTCNLLRCYIRVNMFIKIEKRIAVQNHAHSNIFI